MACSAGQAASCSSLLLCLHSDTDYEPGQRQGRSKSLAPAQTSGSRRTSVACPCSSHPNGGSTRFAGRENLNVFRTTVPKRTPMVNNVKVPGGHATRPIELLSRQFQGLFLTKELDEPVGSNMTTHTGSPKGGCHRCAQKGAIQCLTCTGSGLYVDAILESQGIIVHVRCLGCGGSGEIMCPKCGGRGYM
ncbi:hypothetical protein O6H91_05G125100 [Diphasiastrum complanatum]|uniref:Uncharacterized protein n=1 Tax=Diphasiastrum complanatum TaxID=34168 RepID=A0ACC2DT00_DIPCM|nr:hypothetical protein O6H91_05G125100 [Diphasiastrum complanatum]